MGPKAVRRRQEIQPDVVLMDVVMSEMDVVAATRAIGENGLEVQILALTSFKEDEPDYEQVLSPTQSTDGWLVFTMRMPYKAKVVTAVLFAVAVLWLTELVPLAAAAFLIPIDDLPSPYHFT